MVHKQIIGRFPYMDLTSFCNFCHLLWVHQITLIHVFAKHHVPNSTDQLMFDAFNSKDFCLVPNIIFCMRRLSHFTIYVKKGKVP